MHVVQPLSSVTNFAMMASFFFFRRTHLTMLHHQSLSVNVLQPCILVYFARACRAFSHSLVCRPNLFCFTNEVFASSIAILFEASHKNCRPLIRKHSKRRLQRMPPSAQAVVEPVHLHQLFFVKAELNAVEYRRRSASRLALASRRAMLA